jgi:hypothetical protein
MSTANEFAAALKESEVDIKAEAQGDARNAVAMIDQVITYTERRASVPLPVEESLWWDSLGETLAGAVVVHRREFAVLLAVLVQVETAGLSRELAGFLEGFGRRHEAALRRAGAEIAGTS